MNNNELYRRLAEKTEYQKFLYRYGYLITDSSEHIRERYPFLETWSVTELGAMQFLIHPDQKLFHYQINDSKYFLIGHCYNPIRMLADETDILREMAKAYSEGTSEYCVYLSELTGVFVTGYINGNGITLYGDAAGMLMTYYGCVDGHLWISSHAELPGNLNGLEESEYVKRLTKYRFYPLFGYTLPGDISPYEEFRRLVPNHSVQLKDKECTVKRFYPVHKWDDLQSMYSEEERTIRAAEILKNSMALIPQKWERPAISLTGGCDSKTTLACTAGNYDRYRYFSYISQEAEKVDADGAHTICEKLGLQHKIHPVPEEFEGYEDIELVRDIIAANQGNIGKLKTREAQKRIYFTAQDDFDVEVKSWVSEIGRAYYHKRFSKKSFPKKPTPRYLTTLYKVFLHDRKLVRETDRIFAEYIQKYMSKEQFFGWNWIDLLFWEFRVSSWNGLVITGEHRYSFDITIPYNNRSLLELLLAVPVEMRMQDTLYQKIRAYANPAVDEAGVAITNLKHTNNRAKAERLYLNVHSSKILRRI